MNTDLSSNHQDEVYENNVLNLTANEIIVCNENNKSQGKKRKITTSTESTELIRNNKQQKLTVWDIFGMYKNKVIQFHLENDFILTFANFRLAHSLLSTPSI